MPSRLSDLDDDELIRLFQDEDASLSARLKGILTSGREIGTPPDGIRGEQVLDTLEGVSDEADLLVGGGLRGIYVGVLRKGAGHNDPNWGRISTQIGGRNYGYTHRQPVGDLFAKGDNRFGLEIWCPWYASPGGVTYHSYIELWADPTYWRPGGLIAWLETWGTLRFEKERKLAGREWTWRLN